MSPRRVVLVLRLLTATPAGRAVAHVIDKNQVGGAGHVVRGA